MDDLPITLAAVDHFIAARKKGLTFPDWLERRLEHDTRRRRAQRLRAAVPATVIIYNLFLIPDWMLVGDKFKIAIILHFAIVTPWIVLTGSLTRDDSPKFLREGLAASIPVTIVLQILVLWCLRPRQTPATTSISFYWLSCSQTLFSACHSATPSLFRA